MTRRLQAIVGLAAAILGIAVILSLLYRTDVSDSERSMATSPQREEAEQLRQESEPSRPAVQDPIDTPMPENAAKSSTPVTLPRLDRLAQARPAILLARANEIAEVMGATEQWEAGLRRHCVRSMALAACGFTRHMTTQAAARFDEQSRAFAADFHGRWCNGYKQFEKQFRDSDAPAVVAEITDLIDEDGELQFDGTEPRYTRDEFSVLELELETLSRYSAQSKPSHYREAMRSVLKLTDPACAIGDGLLNVVDQNKQLKVFDDLRRSAQTPNAFRQSLELAIELRSCRASQACGPSSPVTIHACFNAGQCRANESIMDIRRRTTAPDVFEAAERLVIELDQFRP